MFCKRTWPIYHIITPITDNVNNTTILSLKPTRCIKALFYIPENRPDFLRTRGFKNKISIKLFYQYMKIFFNFPPTSNHLHPLQVENCDSNSRLLVNEDDNGKFRLERVKFEWTQICHLKYLCMDTQCSYLSLSLTFSVYFQIQAQFYKPKSKE